MIIGTIDYSSSYFKYKTPTPSRRESTLKTLKRIKLELQANISSIEIYLDRGDHGHQGLVLSDQEH